jgi:hypothetical protein
MKKRGIIGIILGALLLLFGLFILAASRQPGGLIPALIGAALVYLGFRPGRHGLAVFGHACIIVGCMLVAWGVYLLPYSPPKFATVFVRPLFWGLFSIFGGICANYHAFCGCMRRTGLPAQAAGQGAATGSGESA